MYPNNLTPAIRAMLGAKYRINVGYAGQLAGAYAHARNAKPQGSLLVDAVDAQAEIEHVCGLFYPQRKFVPVKVKWGSWRPGQVRTFTYPRYGFDAGAPVLVVTVSPNHIDHSMKLVLWG